LRRQARSEISRIFSRSWLCFASRLAEIMRDLYSSLSDIVKAIDRDLISHDSLIGGGRSDRAKLSASRSFVLARPRQDLDQFLLRHRQRVNESGNRRLAVAPSPLMWPLLVVLDEPGIEVALRLSDPAVKFLTERHVVDSSGRWTHAPGLTPACRRPSARPGARAHR
jgi:hypothetical protein